LNRIMTASAADDDDIRILYVIGGRRIGGTENHLVRLAGSLPASFRCLVCCLDASDDYKTRLTDAGIQHLNLDCASLVRPSGILGYLRFERLVARFQPHIVHSYGFVGDVLAGVLRARRSKVRVITSRRGEDVNRRHQAVRRLFNRWSDKVVCVSSETATFVQSTESPSPGSLEIIPNGVALNPERPLPGGRDRDETVRFGTLGTVKPIKGTDLLVDAFMRFDPKHRVELLIAGLIDRPWAEALRQRAQADTRIRFKGRSSLPISFLADLDVFVLPSRSEGMSNALLEAMASGLPCIATDVGSNRSLLNPPAEPAAGLICDANPESLFSAMSEMASSADARRRYGIQGAARVSRRYTIPSMVQQYECLYRSVVGRASMHLEVAQAPCVTE
jgi:glycosyltransferase involved in cell wall biosynthesis